MPCAIRQASFIEPLMAEQQPRRVSCVRGWQESNPCRPSQGFDWTPACQLTTLRGCSVRHDINQCSVLGTAVHDNIVNDNYVNVPFYLNIPSEVL